MVFGLIQPLNKAGKEEEQLFRRMFGDEPAEKK
jgi:hypothetical protein